LYEEKLLLLCDPEPGLEYDVIKEKLSSITVHSRLNRGCSKYSIKIVFLITATMTEKMRRRQLFLAVLH
jgi:hypothetical protein